MVIWDSMRMVDGRQTSAEEKLADALNEWQARHPDRRIATCSIAIDRDARSKVISIVAVFSSEETST